MYEQAALILDHLEVAEFFLSALARSQPAEFQLSRAHRFFFYYCDNFSFAHHIKMKIQNAKSTADIPVLLSEYFAQVSSFLDTWLPRLRGETRSYVTIAFGCTGGKHRSVYLAETMARHAREQGWEEVATFHRELE